MPFYLSTLTRRRNIENLIKLTEQNVQGTNRHIQVAILPVFCLMPLVHLRVHGRYTCRSQEAILNEDTTKGQIYDAHEELYK